MKTRKVRRYEKRLVNDARNQSENAKRVSQSNQKNLEKNQKQSVRKLRSKASKREISDKLVYRLRNERSRHTENVMNRILNQKMKQVSIKEMLNLFSFLKIFFNFSEIADSKSQASSKRAQSRSVLVNVKQQRAVESLKSVSVD